MAYEKCSISIATILSNFRGLFKYREVMSVFLSGSGEFFSYYFEKRNQNISPGNSERDFLLVHSHGIELHYI